MPNYCTVVVIEGGLGWYCTDFRRAGSGVGVSQAFPPSTHIWGTPHFIFKKQDFPTIVVYWSLLSK